MGLRSSLKFPECWLEGDTITSITSVYTGPSLENAEVVLLFSNGQRLSSTVAEEITKTEGDTSENWTIEVLPFEFTSSGEIDYELFLLFDDPAIPINRATLHKGTVKVDKKIPEPS